MYDLYGNVTVCSAHEQRATDCEEYLNYFYIHKEIFVKIQQLHAARGQKTENNVQ